MQNDLPERYHKDFIYATVQKSLLERLLYGHCREVEYFPQLLEEYGIHFSTERFAVIAVSLPASAGSGGHEKLEIPPEPDIHTQATEWLKLQKDWDSWAVLTDHFYCVILCAAIGHARPATDVAALLLEELITVLPICIAVSAEKEGLGGINDAFYEVTEVVGSINMRGLQNKVVTFTSLDAVSYQEMDTTFERDRKLINYVLEGNKSGALDTLNLIESSSFVDNRNTLMMEKRHMMGVINQMTSEISAYGDYSFMTDLRAFSQIMDAPALEQLFLQYRSLIIGLCDYFHRSRIHLSESRVKAVREYIDDNFANPELSIDHLSGIFKMSPSYLSRIFKRETGNGILVYIQQKRIEKARLLLTGTELKIGDIAHRVGFQSDQTFSRTFKTMTGCTPAVYRSERQKQDKN